MEYIINTEILKQLVRTKNLRTCDLAEQSLTDWAQVKRILSGETQRPRIDTIVRICDVLQVQDIRTVLIGQST